MRTRSMDDFNYKHEMHKVEVSLKGVGKGKLGTGHGRINDINKRECYGSGDGWNMGSSHGSEGDINFTGGM